MKWFKHLSGSLNDNLIFEAMERFGSDGYLVFFGTLELLADEFNITDPGVQTFSIKKMTKNFQISAKKLRKILHFFDKKAKNSNGKIQSFHVEFEGSFITISCPKFSKLCDEYTRVKMSQKSGVFQETLRTKSYTDTDTEAETELVFNPPKGGRAEFYTDKYMDPIVEKCKKIEALSKRDRKKLNIWAFVQGAVSMGGHPKAIDLSLNQAIERWQEINTPYPYMMAIFKMKNGNFWEEEHVRESAQFKEAWQMDEKVQELISKIG